jgi:iron complex transport system ATP-binding protein
VTRFVASLHALKAKRKPVLEIRNLRIRHGDTLILDNICWQVARGQHWIILGANGSGKTSLLSAITGYLPPTDGEISVLGRMYGRSDWRELRKQIGLVSSSVRQMMPDDETALDSVVSGKFAMIGLWKRAGVASRKQALSILRRVQCSHLRNRPWRVLSQGERQRVLIARALMAKPKLLILDEPCAGLDPAAREHFLRFLNRLAGNKISPTLVLVTHHVEEIMPAFTHGMILKSGKVLIAGKILPVMNSNNLNVAFETQIRLRKKSGRYTMDVGAKRGVFV